MSEDVQFTELEQVRWEQYKHFKDLGYTDTKIATQWGLKSTKQVQRLKNKAKTNGAYTQWAKQLANWALEEFKELHAIIKKESPAYAYKITASVAARAIAITQQIQAEIRSETIERRITELDPADRELLNAVARKYITRSNTERPASIH